MVVCKVGGNKLKWQSKSSGLTVHFFRISIIYGRSHETGGECKMSDLMMSDLMMSDLMMSDFGILRF